MPVVERENGFGASASSSKHWYITFQDTLTLLRQAKRFDGANKRWNSSEACVLMWPPKPTVVSKLE